MDKKNIAFLIDQHNNACANIAELGTSCATYQIKNDKDKADFGNMCVALRGYRMVADATEAILINEDILKGKNGEFYQKINLEEEEKQEQCQIPGKGDEK